MERLSLHPFQGSLPIMEKEMIKLVAAISTLGLLTACSETGAIEAKKDSTSVSAQNIRPFVDHDGLARRYENRARKLLEIATEHEKRLQYYEDKSYLYGREGESTSACHRPNAKIQAGGRESHRICFSPQDGVATCETQLYCFEAVTLIWVAPRSSVVNLAGTGVSFAFPFQVSLCVI